MLEILRSSRRKRKPVDWPCPRILIRIFGG